MRGKVTIEASDHGYGIDCELDDVSILDKFELMHALATVITVDADELKKQLEEEEVES